MLYLGEQLRGDEWLMFAGVLIAAIGHDAEVVAVA
jgi:hypothetical protein